MTAFPVVVGLDVFKDIGPGILPRLIANLMNLLDLQGIWKKLSWWRCRNSLPSCSCYRESRGELLLGMNGIITPPVIIVGKDLEVICRARPEKLRNICVTLLCIVMHGSAFLQRKRRK